MSGALFLEGYLVCPGLSYGTSIPGFRCTPSRLLAYGEEIIRQEYAEQQHRKLDEEQLALAFEDPVPF